MTRLEQLAARARLVLGGQTYWQTTDPARVARDIVGSVYDVFSPDEGGRAVVDAVTALVIEALRPRAPRRRKVRR